MARGPGPLEPGSDAPEENYTEPPDRDPGFAYVAFACEPRGPVGGVPLWAPFTLKVFAIALATASRAI